MPRDQTTLLDAFECPVPELFLGRFEELVVLTGGDVQRGQFCTHNADMILERIRQKQAPGPHVDLLLLCHGFAIGNLAIGPLSDNDHGDQANAQDDHGGHADGVPGARVLLASDYQKDWADPVPLRAKPILWVADRVQCHH
jgi:hypothetical protein